MDRDKKITLSLFLTWVVFGLFNLFGQPEAFVPLILVDGLMVTGLGFYFFFPIRKNFFSPLLILFPTLFFIIASVEHNWLEYTPRLWYIGLAITIGIILFFILGIWKLFSDGSKSAWLGSVTALFFLLSLIDLFFNLPFELNPMVYYSLGGLAALLSISFLKFTTDLEHSFKRLCLVLLLSVTFDIGNYLALLQFTSN